MLTFLKDSFRPLYHVLSNKHYRTYQYLIARYGSKKRYTETSVSFAEHAFVVPDVASFINQYREIFFESVYAFPSTRQDPFIIDCGANIGLSCLYFRKTFPSARIIAFEADPTVFSFLKRNMENNFVQVELHNKAVWVNDRGVSFTQEGADGGSVVNGGPSSLTIPSIRLKDILAGNQVDLLKVDIEGAEADVLLDCEDALRNVSTLCFEYHSYRGQRQRLDEILSALTTHGFRYYIQSPYSIYAPLMKLREERAPIDLQLNIFCFRDEK
jgi:FkbM family methyltransferase